MHASRFREKTSRSPLYPLNNADKVIDAALAQPEVVFAARRINTAGLISSNERKLNFADVFARGLHPWSGWHRNWHLHSLFGVAYLAHVGIYIGDMAATTGSAFAIGTTMYARFVPVTMLSLSVWTLVIILLGALYPGWFAARLEPVDALRSL